MSRKSNRTVAAFSYELPKRKDYSVFSSSRNLRALNALAVANAVFEIEKATRDKPIGKALLAAYGSKNPRTDFPGLDSLIHDLLVFVLADDIEIGFRRKKFKADSREEPSVFEPVENLCLFSGGVDSYAGLLTAKRTLGAVEGIFCAHSDQSKMIHIVRHIQEATLANIGVTLRKLNVPSIGARGYAQLRGFLYMVSAAAWMHVLQAHRLIVTECGPTMYQPSFSPLDSITMTTHPVVVRFSKYVIEVLLGREIEILLPFENLTKAEVMAISPEKDGLRLTHSCISQRFGKHDGTCYGCVIRRLAALASGVEDVTYDRNPIEDEAANDGNLFSLLAYCYDILTNYQGMESYEIETVEAYGKRDLFQRFALDNFAALHRLVSGGYRVQSSIQRMYASLTAKIGTGVLETRIVELAGGGFVPAL
jgi:7-cyano-7-deazaguanine synthase in queuosine biosynthesis